VVAAALDGQFVPTDLVKLSVGGQALRC